GVLSSRASWRDARLSPLPQRQPLPQFHLQAIWQRGYSGQRASGAVEDRPARGALVPPAAGHTQDGDGVARGGRLVRRFLVRWTADPAAARHGTGDGDRPWAESLRHAGRWEPDRQSPPSAPCRTSLEAGAALGVAAQTGQPPAAQSGTP